MAGEQDWRESLPPDIKANESLGKFKDVGSLAKSYVEMERMMGGREKLPTAESKDEEWSGLYGKLGRPEKPDGYKFPDIPKDYQVTDEFRGSISSMAHQLGLNQRQFDAMIGWGMLQSKAITDKQMEVQTQMMKELRDKWGFAADANTERAHKTIAMLAKYNAKDPFVTWLEESGNDRNPLVLDFFYRASQELDEDNFVDEHVKKDAADKASAQQKINEIMADRKGPYWDVNSPMHKDTVARVQEYYQILNE